MLWNAVKEGTITQICSDHSPCTLELKKIEEGDFDLAWGGIASLQLGLSCVWTRAREYGVGIPLMFRCMSQETSNLVSLGHKKGSIEVGKDADFVVWNPEESFIVTPELLQMKNKGSPYNDQQLFGTVAATYLRGSQIYDGRTLGTEPTGQWLRHNNKKN